MKYRILLYTLSLLVVSALSILGFNYVSSKYDIKKKEVLGESEVKVDVTVAPSFTPTVTASPTAKPTSKTTVKATANPTTSQTTTQIQTSTKVPVFLVHNGSTKMCDPVGADSVKSASQALKDAELQYQSCYDKSTSQTVSCANNCVAIKDEGRIKCFEDAVKYYWSSEQQSQCQNDVSNQAKYCLDQCLKQVLICPDSRSQYQSSLDSLLSKYCE